MTKEMRIRIPKPDLNAKNQKQTKREPPLFRPPCAIQCSAERVLGEESVKLVDASRAGADLEMMVSDWFVERRRWGKCLQRRCHQQRRR